MSAGDFPTELVTGVGVRLVAPTGGVEDLPRNWQRVRESNPCTSLERAVS
jgi:hypothetical protein